MKREMLTGVFAFLLLLAISCTKENANSPSSSLQSQSSGELSKSAENRITDRAVVGDWILNYDWECDGSYGTTSMTLNADGTWSSGEGYTGHWSKGVGVFVYNFDGYATVYAGDVYPNAIKGLNTTFTGYQGCFYMEPATTKEFKGQRIPGQPDASGKQ